jgi:Right handed beta helix region
VRIHFALMRTISLIVAASAVGCSASAMPNHPSTACRSSPRAVGPASTRPAPPAGRKLYVAPDGADAGACDEAAPCRQIAQAVAHLQPGDSVLVADGLYKRFTIKGMKATQDRPITIFATGMNAVVNGEDKCGHNDLACCDSILIDGSSYITIDGLRSRGAARAGLADLNSTHIQVRNGVFGPNWHWGVFAGFVDDMVIEHNEAFGSLTEHGIYFSNSGDRVTIRNNWVHDNIACGIQINADYTCKPGPGEYAGPVDGITTQALIEGNVIHGNGSKGGAAINLDGVQDSIVRSNLLFGNMSRGIVNFGDADGVEDDRDDDGNGRWGPKGMLIEDNIVIQPRGARPGLLLRYSAGKNIARHNLLIHHDPGRAGLELASQQDAELLDSDHNVLDRVAVGSDEVAPLGTVISLEAWQHDYGKDKASRPVAPGELSSVVPCGEVAASPSYRGAGIAP